MEKLEVGQPIPDELLPFVGMQDGASLQIMRDYSMILFISLDAPKSSEIREIKSGVVQFRLFVKDGILLPLVGFGRELQFELPFNPTMYSSEFISNLGNPLDILCVDRRTKILKVMRMVGLGHTFMDRLKTGWAKAILAGPGEVKSALYEIFYKRSINENWTAAEIVDWRK